MDNVPLSSNHFWQHVFLGRYLTPPEYAAPESYEALRTAARCVRARHAAAHAVLASLPPGSVTRFNLLDCQDWMGREELEELWESISAAAAPGARLLYRSLDPAFSPPPTPAVTQWLDVSDPAWPSRERTGAYAQVKVLTRS